MIQLSARWLRCSSQGSGDRGPVASRGDPSLKRQSSPSLWMSCWLGHITVTVDAQSGNPCHLCKSYFSVTASCMWRLNVQQQLQKHPSGQRCSLWCDPLVPQRPPSPALPALPALLSQAVGPLYLPSSNGRHAGVFGSPRTVRTVRTVSAVSALVDTAEVLSSLSSDLGLLHSLQVSTNTPPSFR